MLSKVTILTVIFLGLTFGMPAEIIKISSLKKAKSPFVIKRDIFSYFKMGSRKERISSPMEVQRTKAAQEEIKDLRAEVTRSIVYEGFIGGNDPQKNIALVTVNGESFTVKKGDMIMEKIKILKVISKMIVVEVNSQTFEINLKEGDQDGHSF